MATTDKVMIKQARAQLGPAARCLFSRSDKILLRDHHPDLLMRYLFPVSYGSCLIYLFSQVPTIPEQDLAVIAKCL